MGRRLLLVIASTALLVLAHTAAARQTLTLTEKLDELVSAGASRVEVLSALGPPTGYTRSTLSYTVSGQIVASYPGRRMEFADPEHAGTGPLRWVLHFDDLGRLHRHEAIAGVDSSAVYDGWRRPDAAGIQTGFVVGFTSIACPGVQRCVAAGGGGLVVSTENGGRSWRSERSGTDTYKPIAEIVISLTGLSAPTPDSLWATGFAMPFPSHGVILHSADGGRSWRFQYEGSFLFPKPALTAIVFADRRHGWAVGNEGAIVATTDGGLGWSSQASGTRKLLQAVDFCDASTGLAVGIDGTVVKTVDGGRTWRARSSPTSKHLAAVTFLGCEEAWIAGQDGILLFTSDGGETWAARASGVDATLTALTFASPERGWAVGKLGTIIHTSDGGRRWSRQPLPIREPLTDVAFVDTENGWAVGYFGTILGTQDGGATWSSRCAVYDCAGAAAGRFYWQPWLR